MKNRKNVFKSSPNVCGVGAIKTVSNLATLALSLNGLRKKEYAAEDSLILSVRDLTNLGLQIAPLLLTRRMREGSELSTRHKYLEEITNFYKDIENHKKIENFLQSVNSNEGNVYDLRNNRICKLSWNQKYNMGHHYTVMDAVYEKHLNDIVESYVKLDTLRNNVYLCTCRRVEDATSEKIYNLKEFTMLSFPLRQNSIEDIFKLFNNIFQKQFDISNIFYIGSLNSNLENVYYLKDNFWTYPIKNTSLPEKLAKRHELITIYYQLGGNKKDRDNTFKGITKEKLESLNDKNYIEIGEYSHSSKLLILGLERVLYAAANYTFGH